MWCRLGWRLRCRLGRRLRSGLRCRLGRRLECRFKCRLGWRWLRLDVVGLALLLISKREEGPR